MLRDIKEGLDEVKRRMDELQEETGMSDMDKSAKKNVVIVWVAVFALFLAIVGAMWYTSKTNPLLCVAIFGAVFFSVGMIAVVKTKITWDTYPVLIFPAVGFLVLVVSVTEVLYKKNTGETIFTTDNITILVTGFFFIIGLLMIVLPILKRRYLQRVCTEPIMARCVYLDSRRETTNGRTKILYAPKWEYSVDGAVYQHQENTYTNIKVPVVGEECELLMNPENPEQVYRKGDAASGFILIMGICFMAFSAFVFYAVFFMQR